MTKDRNHNRSLWGIAWISFFWSMSSLMIFSLLPTFLTEVLHASKTKVGIIEGVAICTAFFFKVITGAISDYIKKRKPLIYLGAIFTVIVKSLFAMATNISLVFAARSIDRIAKGIRSSPTDALIADLSADNERGRNYGLRQALLQWGCVAGSCIATLGMLISHNNYRFVFALAVLPTLLAVIFLVTLVKTPPITTETIRPHWHIKHVRFLPPAFWKLLGVTFLLMMARFSESFVTLRVREIGWSLAFLPLMIVVMDIANASIAYPIGKFSDRSNRYSLLLKGILLLILANILMISVGSVAGAVFSIIVIGLHVGATQGLLLTLVADTTPPDLRGTAFSLYYLVAGTASLLGNPLAGHLSDFTERLGYGVIGSFCGGLVFSTLASILLWIIIPRKSH